MTTKTPAPSNAFPTPQEYAAKFDWLVGRFVEMMRADPSTKKSRTRRDLGGRIRGVRCQSKMLICLALDRARKIVG